MSSPLPARPQAIVAVKALPGAKSRLTAALTPPLRAELTLAMLTDVLSALNQADIDTTVVSPDRQVGDLARDRGARWLPDPTQSLNAALQFALTQVAPTRALIVPGDVPTATARSYRQVLEHSAPFAYSVVPDHSGQGTAALVTAASAPPPRFGVNSAAHHRADGAHDLTATDPARWPDLRLDIDTEDDLWRAQQLGVGAATATFLHRHRPTA